MRRLAYADLIEEVSTPTGLVFAIAVARRSGAPLGCTSANLLAERLADTTRRMRVASKNRADTFDAFNTLGRYVHFVARAHMECVIRASFMAAIEECHNADVRDVLNRGCSLHVLQSIFEDRAWFMEYHRVTAARSKAVDAQIDDLCRESRMQALPLVEGLGIPAE